MKLIEKKSTADIKVLLSSLWIFFLLNMIVKDIHEIAKPEFLAASLARPPIPEELFLVAGILLEIPIAMVVLSRVLNYGNQSMGKHDCSSADGGVHFY